MVPAGTVCRFMYQPSNFTHLTPQVSEFQILQCVISSAEGDSVLRQSVARAATVERTRMYLPHAVKRYLPLRAPFELRNLS
jgi:hypothetical protein